MSILQQKGTGNITLGGTTTGFVTVASPMQATTTLTVGDIDVGRACKMFMWYIEAYHPEAIHEFKCIEDIQKGVI
jgi:hypothetical protein